MTLYITLESFGCVRAVKESGHDFEKKEDTPPKDANCVGEVIACLDTVS